MAENSLVLLSKANQMLAEAKTIDEAKYLMDIASAAKHYAQKHKLGKEAVDHAREIEIRAEILLGEFLREMEKNRGAMGIGKSVLPKGEDTPPTYKEVGITYKEASESQRLASLPEPEKEKVIKGKISKSTVLRKARQKNDEEMIKAKEFPIIQGRFKTILIDPPWDYESLSLAGRGQPEYAVMTIEKLKEIPVSTYAEENCHLYLWTTNNFLYEALKLGEYWGFQYKTILTWIKPSMGLGSYFRNSTEQLLFFVKGKLNTRTENTLTHFEAPRGKHSEKPEVSYQIIENNSYPNYLELFGRKEREGWEVWGNV